MEKNTVLRWVKASERLPDDGGYYFVRIGKLKDKHLLPRMQLIEKWRIYGEGGVEVEWLEESESPAPLSPRRILESIYECEPSDLQFSITLNPDVERIAQAMESYAQQFQSPAPLSAEEIERLSEDYAESVISEDTTATYTAAQAYHHVKKAYKMALLSKRQPVAPERGELFKRLKGICDWWDNGGKLNDGVEDMFCDAQKALEAASPSAENKGASGSADGLSNKGGEG